MKTITSFELYKHRDEISLIDVREPQEYQKEHIEGAILLPLSEISVEKLPSLSGKIVFYCTLGKRSAVACQNVLEQDDHIEAYSLLGGIEAWKKEGFYVQKNTSPKASLDQQSRISAGTLILLAYGLGEFISEKFFHFCALFGLALIFSGLKNHCYLNHFLAYMPWNK